MLPYTNIVILCGGQLSSGNAVDCWQNADGSGSTWTLVSSGAFNNGTGISSSPMVALYDSSYVNSAVYTTPNSTLVFATRLGIFYLHIARRIVDDLHSTMDVVD